ncbi:MAG: ATP-dependent nuclease, partial [Paludibacter sp.]
SNKLLSEHPALKKANQDVTTILQDKMFLKSDQLTTQLQVSGTNALETKKLVSLLEKLDLTVDKADYQNQGRVGLGTSNIMSMACELLLNNTNAQKGYSSFLLIEEPEAHIHAQRQLRLIQSLQNEAAENSHQIILTTHSPLLASVVSLENVTIMRGSKSFSLSKEQTLLDGDDYLYLERYLDATKANLFFAKGIVIVEGPAEELLLPTISKLLGKDLTEYGVSIVNVRGTGLRRYARIFQRKDERQSLGIPVACITDRDIMPDCAPAMCINEKYTSIDEYPQKSRIWKTESEFASEKDKQQYIQDKQAKADGQTVKTFVSGHWTFEYDMAYAGLMEDMLDALVVVRYQAQNRGKKLQEIKDEIDKRTTSEEKAAIFYSYFYDNSTSKAEFAQCLASILSKRYSGKLAEFKAKLPEYIVNAIDFVTEM